MFWFRTNLMIIKSTMMDQRTHDQQMKYLTLSRWQPDSEEVESCPSHWTKQMRSNTLNRNFQTMARVKNAPRSMFWISHWRKRRRFQKISADCDIKSCIFYPSTGWIGGRVAMYLSYSFPISKSRAFMLLLWTKLSQNQQTRGLNWAKTSKLDFDISIIQYVVWHRYSTWTYINNMDLHKMT